METLNKKSPEEIAELKRQWLIDPCWDIDATEGFEAHKEELKAFMKQKEDEWEQAEKNRLKEKAIKLGIPDRIDLIKYFEGLEYPEESFLPNIYMPLIKKPDVI